MKGITNEDLLSRIRAAVREEVRSELKQVNHTLQLIDRKVGESSEMNVKHHLATKAEVGGLSQQFRVFREGMAAAIQPTQ
jgi:hypothetical protein